MGPIATGHLKFCSERGRLLDLMHEATKDYAQAAHDIADRVKTIMAEADYKQARAEAEHARLDAEHAREIYLLHRREHGC